jgi:hypothetical protein
MLQRLTIRTTAQECLVDITAEMRGAVQATGITEGTVLLYVPHTTCGITIQEQELGAGFAGSVRWYVTAVKLDLEARGELHLTTTRGRGHVTVAATPQVPEEQR